MRYRRHHILKLSRGLAGAAVLCATMIAQSVSAQSISANGHEFELGEEIQITWAHPNRENSLDPFWSACAFPISEEAFQNRQIVGPFSTIKCNHGNYRGTINGQGRFRYIPLLHFDMKFVRVAAIVTDGRSDRPNAQFFFTVHQPPLPAAPESIRLANGNTYRVGETITVSINLDVINSQYLDKIIQNRDKISQASQKDLNLRIYRRPRKWSARATALGRFVRPTIITNMRRRVPELRKYFPRGSQQPHSFAMQWPGQYELQLLFSGLLLSNVAFTVRPFAMERALEIRVVTKESIKVSVRRPEATLEFRLGGSAGAYLDLIKVEDGKYRQIGGRGIQLVPLSAAEKARSGLNCKITPEFCVTEYAFPLPAEAGTYEVHLIQNGNVIGITRFEVDDAVIAARDKLVPLFSPSAWADISDQDILGKPFSVYGFVPDRREFREKKLELVLSPREQDADGSDGARDIHWPLTPGVWTKEEVEVPGGKYALQIVITPEQADASPQVHFFQEIVVSEKIDAELLVQNGATYLPDDSTIVHVRTGGNLDKLKHRLRLVVERAEDRLPKCVRGRFPYWAEKEGDFMYYSSPTHEVELGFRVYWTKRPGRYALRLYITTPSGLYKLLDEKIVQIEYPRGRLIGLNDRPYEAGDKVSYRLDATPISPERKDFKPLSMMHFPRNYRTIGGAQWAPRDMTHVGFRPTPMSKTWTVPNRSGAVTFAAFYNRMLLDNRTISFVAMKSHLYASLSLDSAGEELVTPFAPSFEWPPRESQGPKQSEILCDEDKPKKIVTPIVIAENKEPICGIVDDEIYYPATRNFITQENPIRSLPSLLQPAAAGFNVLLHSGRMLYRPPPDLQVKARGFNFVLQRTYAGHMKTENGGLIGHRWDFNLNKQITPMGGRQAKDGLRKESLSAVSRITFADGRGRVETYRSRHSEWRQVKNFGAQTSFRAFVTTYDSPPGRFHEIQRYIVDESGRHPFRDHVSVDASNGESLFYVLRDKTHFQSIFNCRGQFILGIDRFGNRLTLIYGDQLNPLTFNPILRKVIDSSGRTYEVETENLGTGSFKTNFKGELVEEARAPILRIKSLTDPWGRKVEFALDRDSRELQKVALWFGDASKIFQFGYTSDGQISHLLNSIRLPMEKDGVPFMKSTYRNGRIVRQSIGEGHYEFDYRGSSSVKVRDLNGGEHEYELATSPMPLIRSVKITDPRNGKSAKFRYAYNDDGQMTEAVMPGGKKLSYSYDSSNEEVNLSASRIKNWADKDWVYENNLSKGNLLSLLVGASDGGLSVSTHNEYEPLYNQIRSSTDKSGNTTRFDFRYDQPGAEGQPIRIVLPNRTTVQGNVLGDIQIGFEYDEFGQQTAMTNAEGHKTQYEYGPAGAVVAVHRPDRTTHISIRDERGNLIEDQPPDGTSVRIELNGFDQPLRIVQDPGNWAVAKKFDYDANGNAVRIETKRRDIFEQEPGGPAPKTWPSRVVEHEYDSLDRRTLYRETVGSESKEVRYFYDPGGRLIRETTAGLDGEAVNLDHRYNVMDQLLSTEMQGRRTENEYDLGGKVTLRRDANGQETHYRYDGLDRLVEIEDPRGGKSVFTLDLGGKVVAESFFGESGGPSSEKVLLKRLEIEVDEYGAPIRLRQDSLAGGYGMVETKWIYGLNGKLVKEINDLGGWKEIYHDPMGRATRVVDSMGNVMSMRYDLVGRLISMKEHDQTQNYDPATKRYNAETKIFETTFAYDAFGNLARKTQGSFEITYRYDSDGNVRWINNAASGGTVQLYDGFGRPTHIQSRNGPTKFTYNRLGQPLKVQNPHGTETRRYDNKGRLVELLNSGGAGSIKYFYNAAGKVARTIDPRGMEIQNAYDKSGRLISSTSQHGREQYRYDGLDRVTFASSGSIGAPVIVERNYDGLNKVIEERQIWRGDTQIVRSKTATDHRHEKLIYPAAAGAVSVDYEHDQLDRIKVISIGNQGSLYVYSGTDRIALRRTGDGRFVTTYKYNEDRQLEDLITYDAILPNKLFSRSTATYEKGALKYAHDVLYPDGHQQGATLNRHLEQKYDRRGRVVSSVTKVSSRLNTFDPWQHSIDTNYNIFDRKGRLQTIARSHAMEVKEGFLGPRDVMRIVEVRADSFTYDELSRTKQTQSRVQVGLWDSVDGSSGLDPEQILAAVAGPRDPGGKGYYSEDATFEYDANGNLIGDSQFDYSYDHKNRLILVRDRLADKWNRRQVMRYQYDAFGRLVARLYDPFALSNAKAFDRKNVRFIYRGNQVIAELAENWESKKFALLARYYPGARGGEILCMDRRQDDKLGAPLRRYYIHEGREGDIAFVTFDGTELARVRDRPHFTGESGFPQGTRDERFIGDSRTRMPLISRGLRYDAFTRMNQKEGSGSFIKNFRGAPMLEYQRYLKDNYASILERIQKHHPRPKSLRYMEYAMVGAIGLAMAPMIAVAAEGLLIMEAEALIGAGTDFLISSALGHEYRAEDMARSFAFGAVTGGIGQVVGAATSLAGLTYGKAMAVSIAVDSLSGTAFEVAVYGSSFREAILTNSIGAMVGGALMHPFLRPKSPKPSPNILKSKIFADAMDVGGGGGAASGLTKYTPTDILPAIKHIDTLAKQGMFIARLFMISYENGLINLSTTAPSTSFAIRKFQYLRSAEKLRGKVLVIDPGLEGGLGLHQRSGTNKDASYMIVNSHFSFGAKRLQSPKIQAVSILHEFSHSHGAGELQAFHITFEAMVRLGMHLHPAAKDFIMALTAGKYMALQAASSSGKRLKLLKSLGVAISRNPGPGGTVGYSYFNRTWRKDPFRRDAQTNPDYWKPNLSPRPF